MPITQWAITEGAGSLARTGAGSTNTYTAPGPVSGCMPVTVTARVKSAGGSLLLLVSSLLVMPEGIAYRIDGGPWVHAVGSANRLAGQVVHVGRAKSTDADDRTLAFTIVMPSLVGTQNIRMSWGTRAVFTGMENRDGVPYYQSLHKVGAAVQLSAGGIYMNQIQYQATGSDLVESVALRGSFVVANAGVFTPAIPYYLGEHVIEGFFCLGKFR